MRDALRGRATRAVGLENGCALSLGILLVLVGVWIGGALARAPWRGFDKDIPPMAYLPFAVMPLVVGVRLIARGLLCRRRRASSSRLLLRDARARFLEDYAWDAKGAETRFGEEAIEAFFTASVVGLTVFGLTAWNLLAEVPLEVALFFYLLNLLAALPLLRAGRHLARGLKFGRSTLRWKTFPATLGGVFEADFAMSCGARRLKNMKVTLRCVRERLEPADSEDPDPVPHEIWAETRPIEPAVPRHSVSFALPSDPALSTCLSEQPGIWWELEVTADAPGLDYVARFKVPIYAPSR